MTPLKSERERALGYATKGLKMLTGLARVEPQLTFTRAQFVQYLPKEQQGMSISGYQPKLQMVLEDGAFAVVESKGNYILKPSPVDFPQLAENEYATMTVMARLGFDVPPHGLLPFKPENDGDDLEYAFVIRRFDQEGEKDVAAGFNTQYGEYLGMDFLVLGQSMGLSERLASALLKRLLKEQAVVESTYRDSFMQADAVAAVLRCYRQRLSRLQILDEPALG
ncbi:HipA domain-containing protein [Erwinia persicina]|uniref:HipA domain-containing protein n=1 Tax=Erwinia persicina TaxID=55211 RepID=UPI00078853AF|nr:HipA domain-containing protein [Erwinia persicina]